jgi:hypothetical protein
VLAATLNEALPLQMLLTDGRTDLYGQVRLYNASGSLVSTLNLAHVTEGLYQVSWTPSTEGWFTAVFEMYFDAGRTVDAGYEKQGEQIEVSTTKTNILRVLGLTHENSVVDQQVYDMNGRLTSARIRSYDSKANAQAATLVGLRFQYTVQAEFTGGALSKYQILRDI